MSRYSLWIAISAVLFAFAGGFLVANGLNRSELGSLRAENDRLKSASKTDEEAKGELTLTNEEIQAKIDEANSNPGNFEFQKGLGIGLYRYAAMKKDVDLLRKAIPLLDRVHVINADDYSVLVALGNAHFDVGYFAKENAALENARQFYSKALKAKPNDAGVRTDFGLTYFLQEPPDYKAATSELERALKDDPKSERSMEYLIQALVKQERREEAAKYLEQLRAANPKSPSLSALSSEILGQPAANQ